MTRHTVAIDKATTRDTWETPPAIFHKLNQDFGPFELDLTADKQRCLIYAGTFNTVWPAQYFGPGSPLAEDALAAPWIDFGYSGYANPPYGPFVPQILRKAVSERDKGFTTTLLLPMRVTKAFLGIILPEASALYFCDRRICFFEHGKPRWNASRLHPPQQARGRRAIPQKVPDPAMFDSIIVRFDPAHCIQDENGVHPKPLDVEIWHVPPHTAPETYA